MSPEKGCLGTLFGLCLLVLLIVGGSCSSAEFIEPRSLTAREISGIYRSVEPVGVLGLLQLELVRFEQSRVYAARVQGDDEEQFGSVEGIGTLADDHLVLHIDRGMAFDYYFEGAVQVSNSGTTITGEFIFPDQAEQQPVVFVLQP